MTKLSVSAAAARVVLHRLSAILLIALLVFAAFCVTTLLMRSYQKHVGVGAVSAPGAPAAAYGDQLPSKRFTANLTYTSIDAPATAKSLRR